jgi:hypothetical protein
MPNFIVHICTICGRKKTKAGWFLMVENRWEDTLKIFQWDDRLAVKAGVHEVCSAAHVRELAVHWMGTGSLRYPFARNKFMKLRSSGVPNLVRPNLNWPNYEVSVPPKADLDTSSARQLGELAVHRESIKRVLNENPHSLKAILDELVFALRQESETGEGIESAEVMGGVTARQV